MSPERCMPSGIALCMSSADTRDMTTETYRGYLIREFPEGYTVADPDGLLHRGFDDPAPTLRAARQHVDLTIDCDTTCYRGSAEVAL